MTEPNEYAADPGELMNRSVDELELSVRTANMLMNLEVKTIGDLVKLTEQDVLKAPHANKLVLKELEELLSEMGLALGMTGVS